MVRARVYVLIIVGLLILATGFLYSYWYPNDISLSPILDIGSDAFNSLPLTCPAPFYLATTFPPSEITPRLPPQNERPYTFPSYVCRHFAFDFCEATKKIPNILACNLLYFDKHMINTILYKDPITGKYWVCFVEPQTNQHYCVSYEQGNPIGDDWIRKKLCAEFYNKTQEECDMPIGEFPRCQDVIGEKCQESSRGKKLACLNGVDDGDIVRELSCKCSGTLIFRECTWQPSLDSVSSVSVSSN